MWLERRYAKSENLPSYFTYTLTAWYWILLNFNNIIIIIMQRLTRHVSVIGMTNRRRIYLNIHEFYWILNVQVLSS